MLSSLSRKRRAVCCAAASLSLPFLLLARRTYASNCITFVGSGNSIEARQSYSIFLMALPIMTVERLLDLRSWSAERDVGMLLEARVPRMKIGAVLFFLFSLSRVSILVLCSVAVLQYWVGVLCSQMSA